MKHRILQLVILCLLLTPVFAAAASSTVPPSDRQEDQGTLDLHVTWNGINVTGAPVYTGTGTYLDRCTATDARGHVQFTVPITPHNFRVEYRGKEYWTGSTFAIADQKLEVEVPLEQLADISANNPNSTRYDGEPPIINHEPVQVASIGTYIGILSQASIAQVQPQSKVYYFITDHLGTPMKMMDEAGGVVWSADYRPFGELSLSNATAENNFRFPGQYYDQETELHYNYYRFYAPRIGRYLSVDPVGYHNVIKRYLYVGNNPLLWEDFFGLLKGKRHREITNDEMVKAGFSQRDAEYAAKASERVDTEHFFDDEYHGTPGKILETYDLIDAQLEKAVELEVSGKHKEAMEELGIGSHPLQDIPFHLWLGGSPFEMWLWHLIPYAVRPDDPERYPAKDNESCERSRWYIEKFRQEVGKRRGETWRP